MTVMTDKISDTVALRLGAARDRIAAKREQAAAKRDLAIAKGDVAATKAATKAAAKGAVKGSAKGMRMSPSAMASMLKGTTGKVGGKVGVKVASSLAPASAKVAGRHLAEQAAEQANRQFLQARAHTQELMHDKVIPTVQERIIPTVQHKVMPAATSAIGSAMVASAPFRKEAIRRATLAGTALRGGDAMVIVKKRRMWPIALLCLGLGGLAGAAAAWFSQAGKPMQMTPYPLPTSETDTTVDLGAEERSRHDS